MMAGPVPPQIETPKTFIGVGARELVILAAAALLDILILLTPLHLVVRVILAVLLMGLGLAIAFGRDQRSGKTVEAVLLDMLRFYKRARLRQKGTDTAQPQAHSVKMPAATDSADEPLSAENELAGEQARGLFTVKPLPLGAGLFFSIVSLAFLAGLLAWLWLGGVLELRIWLLGQSF